MTGNNPAETRVVVFGTHYQHVGTTAIVGFSLSNPFLIVADYHIAKAIGDDCVDFSGLTQLGHVTTLVSLSNGVVSNDTGLAHMAAAEDVPIVVICGPTQAERVKPAGEKVVALQAPMECFDTLLPENCMSLVTPEMVIEALAIH